MYKNYCLNVLLKMSYLVKIWLLEFVFIEESYGNTRMLTIFIEKLNYEHFNSAINSCTFYAKLFIVSITEDKTCCSMLLLHYQLIKLVYSVNQFTMNFN